jgi:hypothetical protein
MIRPGETPRMLICVPGDASGVPGAGETVSRLRDLDAVAAAGAAVAAAGAVARAITAARTAITPDDAVSGSTTRLIAVM